MPGSYTCPHYATQPKVALEELWCPEQLLLVKLACILSPIGACLVSFPLCFPPTTDTTSLFFLPQSLPATHCLPASPSHSFSNPPPISHPQLFVEPCPGSFPGFRSFPTVPISVCPFPSFPGPALAHSVLRSGALHTVQLQRGGVKNMLVHGRICFTYLAAFNS